jgi:hypothetical protein
MAGMGNHPRRSAFPLVLVAVAWACLGLFFGPAMVAQAHPLGPPQQATLSLASATQVRINWKAGASDDLSWLAYDLGLLPADRIMLDGAITPQSSDAGLLADSPALAAYLSRQMTVQSQGQPCQPLVSDTHNLATDGASVIFTCPAPVSQATIELRLLTDLEASYATIATGPDGAQATYTGYATTREWQFDPSAAPATPIGVAAASGLSWPVLLVAVPLVAGLGIWILRGRIRPKQTP